MLLADIRLIRQGIVGIRVDLDMVPLIHSPIHWKLAQRFSCVNLSQFRPGLST